MTRKPAQLTVYGIKSCDSCRKAKKFLQTRGIDYAFHDVRADGIDIQMLERWAARIDWEKLLNRKSLTWRKLPEADRAEMNRNKAFVAIIEQPTLLKRPLFEHPDYLAVGFSEQRFADYLDR